jgi:hypothetical protein
MDLERRARASRKTWSSLTISDSRRSGRDRELAPQSMPDITDRKLWEERRRMLLRDAHRLENTFAVGNQPLQPWRACRSLAVRNLFCCVGLTT